MRRTRTMGQLPTICTGWQVLAGDRIVHSGVILNDALAARRRHGGILERVDHDVSPWLAHYGEGA